MILSFRWSNSTENKNIISDLCPSILHNRPFRLGLRKVELFLQFIYNYLFLLFISQHKAFTEVFLDDSHTPTNCHVSLTVSAPLLGLAVRFPIPDLRSDQERGPWFKKSLQKEVLHLELEDLEVKTEFMGGSSPDQTKMELTFRELIGM